MPKNQAPQVDQSSFENDDAHDLNLAAAAIFEGGSSSLPVHVDGKVRVVTAKQATMGTLPAITKFFNDVLGNLSPEQTAVVVDTLVQRQSKRIAEGLDPNDISVVDLDSDELVSAAFGKAGVLLTLFSAAAESLPTLVGEFTNLTPDEYRKLEMDQGILVAGAVFMVNYSFFSQRLLPVLQVSLRGLLARQAQKS